LPLSGSCPNKPEFVILSEAKNLSSMEPAQRISRFAQNAKFSFLKAQFQIVCRAIPPLHV
jgi:hypothetical protein